MKRIIVLLVSLAMLLGVFCVSAYAAPLSGSYSDTVTWRFNTTTLELSFTGSGVVGNGDDMFTGAWRNYASSIKKLTIGEGITEIGCMYFGSCTGIETVSLPKSLKVIDDLAFSSCYALKSVNIPSGVEYIGYGAFDNCYALEEIVFPSGLKEVGYGALGYCTSLKKISIESGNRYYKALGNCLINIASKSLVAGCQTSVIPSDGSVKIIETDAFAGCTGLKTIDIPNTVTTIEGLAFEYCSGLKSLHIPSSVREMHGNAFSDCPELSAITVDESNSVFYSYDNCVIRRSNRELVLGCRNSVIPKDQGIRTIGGSAFFGHSRLKSVTIPNSVTEISNCAFARCSVLTRVVIPNSVRKIEYGAFMECNALKTIIFCGTKSEWDAIAKEDEWGSPSIKIVYHDYEYESDDSGRHNGVCKECESFTSGFHSFGAWTKNDTTYHKRVCECGEAEYVEHEWDEGKVTKEPTHFERGKTSHTCAVCNGTKTEYVDKLVQHVYGDWELKNANNHIRHCDCGETEYGTHEWSEGEVIREATVDEEGIITYTCLQCKTKKDEMIEKLVAKTTITTPSTSVTTAQESKDNGCGASLSISGVSVIALCVGATLGFFGERKKRR